MTIAEQIAMRRAGFTYTKIAAKAGLPMGTIRSRLQRWGIRPDERPLREHRRPPTVTKDLDPEQISRMYWEEELSVCQIGERFGINESTISQFMHRHQIPFRARGDAQRLAHSREMTPRRWASMSSARARQLAALSVEARRRAA